MGNYATVQRKQMRINRTSRDDEKGCSSQDISKIIHKFIKQKIYKQFRINTYILNAFLFYGRKDN